MSIANVSPLLGENIKGDFNKDGIIDDKDRIILERALGADRSELGWIEECDLDESGFIDFLDLEILKKNLGLSVDHDLNVKTEENKKEQVSGISVKTHIMEKTPLLQIDSFILEKIDTRYFAAEVLIDINGSVMDIKISKGTGYKPTDVYILTEMKKWKFEPVTIDQNIVDAWIYCKIDLKKPDFQNPLYQKE